MKYPISLLLASVRMPESLARRLGNQLDFGARLDFQCSHQDVFLFAAADVFYNLFGLTDSQIMDVVSVLRPHVIVTSLEVADIFVKDSKCAVLPLFMVANINQQYIVWGEEEGRKVYDVEAAKFIDDVTEAVVVAHTVTISAFMVRLLGNMRQKQEKVDADTAEKTAGTAHES